MSVSPLLSHSQNYIDVGRGSDLVDLCARAAFHSRTPSAAPLNPGQPSQPDSLSPRSFPLFLSSQACRGSFESGGAKIFSSHDMTYIDFSIANLYRLGEAIAEPKKIFRFLSQKSHSFSLILVGTGAIS